MEIRRASVVVCACVALSSLVTPAFGMEVGDIDFDGDRNVADVQCEVLVSLDISPEDPATTPSCLASATAADLDCDGEANIVDVQLLVRLVLGELMGNPSFPGDKDPDADLVHNNCDLCPDTWDPEQLDTDADLMGDACDPYPAIVMEPGGCQDGDFSAATEGCWACVCHSDHYLCSLDDTLCDDGNPCTADFCDPLAGCTNPALPPGVSTCSTDWSVISESLNSKLDLLPSPPATPLVVDWPEHQAQVYWDAIFPDPTPQGWVGDDNGCNVGLWDPDRVSVGGAYTTEEGEDRCWVTANHTPNTTRLEFRNRTKNSIWDVVVGDPAWVQMRFPVPPGHSIWNITLELGYGRLFGYPPAICPESHLLPDGSCNVNTAEPWGESAPGLYLLWTTPGATHYEITGPHYPTEGAIKYLGVTLTPELPDFVHDVDEFVVTVLVYRQSPRGCVVSLEDGEEVQTCQNDYYTNLYFYGAEIETRATELQGTGPPVERPRIFGTNAQWLADHQAFDDMPCITIEQSENVVGDLENIKNLWDKYTLGARPCEGEAIPNLAEHPDISPYLGDIAALKEAETWKPNPRGALHAIRRTKACLEGASPETCQATQEELATIIDAFKAEELASMDDATWCATACSVGFDLQTGPLMYRWSIFVDTLWDDLTQAEHDLVAAKLGEMIDNFLVIGEIHHWTIFNGNNWTPALVHGALAWAIAYYHEDLRALDVAILGVGSMWWHEDIWKSDGAYEEGISYGGHDMALLYLVTRLYVRSFGTPHFMPWEYLEKSAGWFVDMMATDGWTLDFGDSNKSIGWGTNAPMMTGLVHEWVDETPGVIDPCLARDYWAHKYYSHGFNDPWLMLPWMARDWPAIIAACDEEISPTEIANYPVGGWSTLRSYQPGSSGLTATLPPGHKGHDADKTMLAASSVPNGYAHMEADFGTIIWSAFGSRLIADMGYGSQAKDVYALEKKVDEVVYEMVDNGALGHATLYVPEASFSDSYTGLMRNTSQIKGGIGTAVEGTWGDAQGVHLDGAMVYGKVEGNPVYAEAEEYGWLQAFDRWLIMLPGGHFLVVDSFLKRDDREDVSPVETWTFYHAPPDDPGAACKYNKLHTEVSLVDTHTVQIEPICSMLFYSLDSTTVGRILAASLSPGAFTEAEVYQNYKNNGGLVTHKRVRYEPDAPVAHDVRVFALLAAPSAAAMPQATLDPVDCGADACFDLTLDGAVTSIHLSWNGQRHVLSGVGLPE